MLLASEEGQEIDGSGHSHVGDMSHAGVSILQHVSFSVHIILSIQNTCLTMVTLYDCRHHRRSLDCLFGLDLPIVQRR